MNKYIGKKYHEVMLNHLKEEITFELQNELSIDPSLVINVFYNEIDHLQRKIYFLRVELKEKTPC